MVSRQYLIASAAVALTVASVVTGYVRSVERAYESGTRSVSVTVVARAIGARQVIRDGDVRQVIVPARLLVDGAVRAKRDAVGMISQIAMYPGEQVLASKLTKSGTGGGMIGSIPSGRRAVTVKLDADVGLIGNIAPGDSIDVISIITDGAGGTGQAVTIAQAVPVIAVSGVTEDADPRALAGVTTPCAVLAATPDEVQVLALAQEAGSLRLTVRHPGDRTLSAVSPSSIQQILRSRETQPRRAVTKAMASPPVEVIRINGEPRDVSAPVKEVFWEGD